MNTYDDVGRLPRASRADHHASLLMLHHQLEQRQVAHSVQCDHQDLVGRCVAADRWSRDDVILPWLPLAFALVISIGYLV